jgi:transposase
MWTVRSWILHPAHAALSIRQFLAKHSVPTLPLPPYSPDLSSLNFFYSLSLKLPLKEEDFTQWKTSSLVRRWLKGNTTNVLADLPKVEKVVGEVLCCVRGLIWRGL